MTRSARPAVVTTSWDDGHPLDQRIADLLSQNGLSGTFYIPRQSQLATLTEGQVAALGERFEIGAHTMDHLALTTLSNDEAKRQIVESRQWVQDVTGKPCPMFCPPLGKFSTEHLREIASAGFLGYRSVELLRTEWPRWLQIDAVGERGLWPFAPQTSVLKSEAVGEREDEPSMALWEMPTSVQAHPHRRVAYLRNAMKRRRTKSILQAATRISISDWPQLLETMSDRAERVGGVLHLWGHSWEIDQNDQWESLEAVLKLLGERVQAGRLQPLTNGQVCELAQS